ncbi:MAG: HNH endonuclease [Oscillatoriales cyanobacterium]|nr:MAG: HNH endonuclease [Oscillatoriales cyanobacterium]
MTKTPRIPIPPEVRKYVFTRNKYQCQSCGQTKLEAELSIDHINLQTLCCTCNQRKTDKLDPRFKRHFDL